MPDSTEIIKRVHEELPEEARGRWTEADVQTFAATVNAGLTPNELKMVLSIAAKYDLDPLLREIWGARGKNNDGSAGRLLIMVGRDGLLRNARRQAGYRGFDCDVVRAKDEFKVERRPDGHRAISHTYEGGPDARGEILGAWAQVYQDGKADVYYFAPFKDYAPESPNKRSSWATTPGLMIQKCALSYALRLAFNMSGVLGEEEADRVLEVPEAQAEADLGDVLEMVPEGYRQRVEDAYGAIVELGGAVSVASLQMRFAGQPEEAVSQAVADLERYAKALHEERSKAQAEAEPPDAEVVDAEDPVVDEELRSRLAELTDRKREIEENPGLEGETNEALDEVNAEIDQITGLLAAGDPAQEQLL